MLSYVDDSVYWYTYEALGKWFVENLGNIFNVKFLVYAHFFMSISISQINYHYISVYQARYYTSVVVNYLYTTTFKTSIYFYKNTLPYDIIFTKDGASTSDEEV